MGIAMSAVEPGIDLSICWQFGESTTPHVGLRRLASYGYEGIELWPDSLAAHPIGEWKDALAETGLRIFQLCPYFNFMEGQPKIDASRRILDEHLTIARETGCKRIRVFTGPPWGDGVVFAKDATGQQWADAIHGLTEFCDIASTDGVELCLECHEGSLMEDSPNTLRLIGAVDRPNLTVNLQIPFYAETWEYSVEQLGRHTTHLHIHNWTKGFGEGDITFLDSGAFDWQPVIDTLVKKYKRHVTLSLEHITHASKDDPWETAARDIHALTRIRMGL